jgi:hypothetical protein
VSFPPYRLRYLVIDPSCFLVYFEVSEFLSKSPSPPRVNSGGRAVYFDDAGQFKSTAAAANTQGYIKKCIDSGKAWWPTNIRDHVRLSK